jgi:hypothetical protein
METGVAEANLKLAAHGRIPFENDFEIFLQGGKHEGISSLAASAGFDPRITYLIETVNYFDGDFLKKKFRRHGVDQGRSIRRGVLVWAG